MRENRTILFHSVLLEEKTQEQQNRHQITKMFMPIKAD